MSRKALERLHRTEHLTDEQVQRDEQVRQGIQQEFPPARCGELGSGTFTELLRQALRTSERPVEEVSREAGVSAGLVSRFLNEEADLHLRTAERLAHVVGLEVRAAL